MITFKTKWSENNLLEVTLYTKGPVYGFKIFLDRFYLTGAEAARLSKTLLNAVQTTKRRPRRKDS